MPHTSREDTVAHSIKSHHLWVEGAVRVHHLRGNERAKDDALYAEYLLRVGDGREPTHASLSPFAIRLPTRIAAPSDWDVTRLVEHTYPNLVHMAHLCGSSHAEKDDYDYFQARAILAPTNRVVNDINKDVLAQLEASGTNIHTYYSRDSIQGGTDNDYAHYPVEFLNSLEPNGLPPHELRLAPGALIMLLRNLDTAAGLCNGARCIVKHCLPRVVDVLVLTGRASGTRIYIPRISLAPHTADLPFVLCRRQFPVRLAWAMTINKAQGQTMSRVGVALPEPVFSHGQLYVALSRVGGFDHVKVLVLPGEHQGHYEGDDRCSDGTYTDNVVWPEALLPDSVASQLLHPDACAAAADLTGCTLDVDEALLDVRSETGPAPAPDIDSDEIPSGCAPTLPPEQDARLTAAFNELLQSQRAFHEAEKTLLAWSEDVLVHLISANSPEPVEVARTLGLVPAPGETLLAALRKHRALYADDASDGEATVDADDAASIDANADLSPDRTEEEMRALLLSLQLPHHVRRGDPHGQNNCLTDSLLQSLAAAGLAHHLPLSARERLCREARAFLVRSHGVSSRGFPLLQHDFHAEPLLSFFRNLGDRFWKVGVDPFRTSFNVLALDRFNRLPVHDARGLPDELPETNNVYAPSLEPGDTASDCSLILYCCRQADGEPYHYDWVQVAAPEGPRPTAVALDIFPPAPEAPSQSASSHSGFVSSSVTMPAAT